MIVVDGWPMMVASARCLQLAEFYPTGQAATQRQRSVEKTAQPEEALIGALTAVFGLIVRG
ncbi:MAG: hypothetical protein WCO56_07445 [Verrucomicrobiota bacterium]